MDVDLESWPQEDCFAKDIADDGDDFGDRNSWPPENCFAPEMIEADIGDDVVQGPYGSLSREHNEIRLVEVLPGNPSDPIQCRISTFALDEAPEYTALSYTWGRSDPDCTIELNGHRMPSRKNLWRFLHQIRKLSAWRGTRLWIDAICINQADNQERSHQVALMATIYGLASHVLVWLGPGYGDSDVAFKALRSFKKKPSRVHKFWWRSEGAGLRRICERRYWTRLWIVQELALAKEIILLCGEERVPWQALLDVVNSQGIQAPAEVGPVFESTMKSPAASMIEQTKRAKESDSLWTQILASAHLGCSEPRDRIFALLGIVVNGHQQIWPDYNLSLSSLLNTVLKNRHESHYPLTEPESLLDVKNECRSLAHATGVETALIFDLRDADPASTFDFESYPLQDEKSGMSFWWAMIREHRAVQNLWIRKQGKGSLYSALSHLARLGEEGLCRALVNCASLSNDEPHLSTMPMGLLNDNGDFIYRPVDYHLPLVEAARGGFSRIVELLLRLYVRTPHGILFSKTLKACLKSGHEKMVPAILHACLENPHLDIESLSSLVHFAALLSDTRLLQTLCERIRAHPFDLIDGELFASILFDDTYRHNDYLLRFSLKDVQARHECSSNTDLSSLLLLAIYEGRADILIALLDGELVTTEDLNSTRLRKYLERFGPEYRMRQMAAKFLSQRDVYGDAAALSLFQQGLIESLFVFEPAGGPIGPDSQLSALATAVWKYNVQGVELLLRRQDLAVRHNPAEPDLIRIAAHYNNPNLSGDWRGMRDCGEPIMEMLLRSPKVRLKANRDFIEWSGRDALLSEKPAIVKLLLREGDLARFNETTPLLHSCINAANTDMELMVELLLERPELNVNQEGPRGTALMEAALNGQTGVVKSLLRRSDLDVAFVDRRGSFALSCAVTGDNSDVVKLLLLHKTKKTLWTDRQGSKLVLSAVNRGQGEIVHALLELADFELEMEVRMKVEEKYPELYNSFIWPRLGPEDRALDTRERLQQRESAYRRYPLPIEE